MNVEFSSLQTIYLYRTNFDPVPFYKKNPKRLGFDQIFSTLNMPKALRPLFCMHDQVAWILVSRILHSQYNARFRKIKSFLVQFP